VGLTLTTPGQILEANAGFRREMTLANSESTTVEEELTWSVDSQVAVLGRHVGEAKLVILEQEYEGRFTVKSHIRYDHTGPATRPSPQGPKPTHKHYYLTRPKSPHPSSTLDS